ANGDVPDGLALTTLTPSSVAVGTPEYMSPERARGLAATGASDLFSLGATLYFAVEGRSPFRRDTLFATSAAVMTEEPQRPENAGALDRVLTGLLLKEPERRLTAGRARELLGLVVNGNVEHRGAEPAKAGPGTEPAWPFGPLQVPHTPMPATAASR